MPGLISILRIPLSLVAIAMPGYCLSLALFPERISIDSLERFAIAITTGVALASLEGFILLKLDILLNPLNLLLCSLAVSVIFAATGFYRMYRRAPSLRPNMLSGFKHANKLLWALGTLVLAASVAGAILVTPIKQPEITEFYIPPAWFENTGKDYINLQTGSVPLNVPVEIINLGPQTAQYRIVAYFDETRVWQRNEIQLDRNGQHVEVIPIPPYQLSVPHVLRIELYKNNSVKSIATLTMAIG